MPNIDHRFASTRKASRRALLCSVLALVGVGLAATLVDSAAAATATTAKARFPLTINNCGRTLHLKRPPKRVVGLDQITTELLLHLGVSKSVVGTANQSDPPFPSIAGQYQKGSSISVQ